MKIAKIPILILSFILELFLFAKITSASEGTIELRSTTQEKYKCFAASLRMQNLEFEIPFSCRNLIYPVDDTIFNYVVWAQPLEAGKDPIRLGTLGLGKGKFKTKTPFSALFVTVEARGDTKTPSGKVVMRGTVKPIEFLEKEEEEIPTPSPTLSPERPQPQEEAPKVLSTREKLVLAIKRAGLAALLALAGLIGLVFVITRSKG